MLNNACSLWVQGQTSEPNLRITQMSALELPYTDSCSYGIKHVLKVCELLGNGYDCYDQIESCN